MRNYSYKFNQRSAFSLIELAVVIFVISVMVVVTVSGNRFIERARRNAAIDITKNSPVTYIDDLALWLESSQVSNFKMDDERNVSEWYDSSGNNNNLTQDTSTSQPKFSYDGMDGFSALLLDGSNDSMSRLVNQYSSDSTIFIVYKRVGIQNDFDSLFSSYTSATGRCSFQTDYYGNQLRLAASSLAGTTAVSDYIESEVNDDTNIIGIVMTDSNDVIAYFNGTKAFEYYDIADGFLANFNTYKVGLNRNNSAFFGGYIAEIILYNRGLPDSERQAVESYLAKKYNLNIS